MFPWFAVVASSKYLHASHAEVRDTWSLRELVDYIYFHRGLAAQEEAQHKKASRTPRTPKL
jgi:hypothetical protein